MSSLLNAYSIFFSTLDTPRNESMKFTDPYAKQLGVACASIPRSAGDAYNLSWTGPGSSNRLVFAALSRPAAHANFFSPLTADAVTNSSTGGFPLQFTIVATINTSDGARLLYADGSSWDLSGGVAQLGGAKATAASPPTFWRTFAPLRPNCFP